MLFIFPILFCFSFFIWSCSVLMMMQIVRCESAVAQGLRSDVLQATTKTESASMRPTPPHSLWPVVADLPPPTTSLAPKCPKISDTICLWETFAMYSKIVYWLYFQISHVLTLQCSYWLTPFPFYSEILYGCWVCASLVFRCSSRGCCCLTWPISERSSEVTFARSKVAQTALWCIVVVMVAIDTHTHHALAFVAHALQGPSLARTV